MRALYALTILAGAALLFWVEPLVSKLVLPMLGGTPAVWNTCVLFFQVSLLCGYLYAHVLSTRFAPKTQVIVHVALVVAAALALPVGVDRVGVPPPGANPIPWLLGALTLSVGAPFFVLSTTSPLLQRWYARVSQRDPYPLYVASNVGSLLALLAFPLLLEPTWTLRTQGRMWTATYALFAVLVALSARILWKSAPASAVARETQAPEPIAWLRRLKWVGLSFAPSSLMLGVTNYISTDLASVPLLWIVPLAIYLLTFVLAFASPGGGPLRRLTPIFLIAAFFQLFLMITGWNDVVQIVIGAHLVTFFLAARVCHGALAGDRPSPARLTEFYLWISIGGVLGGLLNGVIAPLVFDSLAEYPLALLLAIALAPRRDPQSPLRPLPALVLPLAGGLVLMAVWWPLRGLGDEVLWIKQLVVYGLPGLLLLASLRRPLRFALGAGPVLLATVTMGLQTDVLHVERSFFGVHRVVHEHDADTATDFNGLMHGSTLHGLQRRTPDAERRREPLVYYTSTGPVGGVFRALAQSGAPRKVALIGLGVGSLASYGREGDTYTCYEIDPAVLRIARNSRYFSFLSEARGAFSFVLGDARLELAASKELYDLIVVDAFSSDAIPVHLLTREAFGEVYLPHLAPGGKVLVHLSNKYLQLERVGLAVGRSLDLAMLLGDDDDAVEEASKLTSMWMIFARTPADLEGVGREKYWVPMPERAPTAVWTDDFSNLFSVFVWKRR